MLAALNDPDKQVVVQEAPAIRAQLGEEFGMAPGTIVSGKLHAALRRMKFDAVFDTNFTADMTILEEGTELKLDFDKITKGAQACRGVIPVAVQNADTGEVILVAYTNEEAFRRALSTRTVVLWSTSRHKLWEKGKESGETFHLVEVLVNCEQNSLLYRARPNRGGICHTRNRKGEPRNCYYRRVNPDTLALEHLDP